MPSYYEIPTSSTPQTFSIQLAGVTYIMSLNYHGANAESSTAISGYDTDSNSIIDTNQIGAWILDIYDATNAPIVAGIPLIPGIDLLYQYQYLNFGGSLVVSTDSTQSVPTFDGLGTTSHLYFVTFP